MRSLQMTRLRPDVGFRVISNKTIFVTLLPIAISSNADFE